MCDVYLMQVKAGVEHGRVQKEASPAWLRALGSFPSILSFQTSRTKSSENLSGGLVRAEPHLYRRFLCLTVGELAVLRSSSNKASPKLLSVVLQKL